MTRFPSTFLMRLQKIERFFSSSVTHVVTTRTIPPEGPQKASQQDRASFQNETVNPLLIQKNGDSLAALRTQQKKRAAGSVNGRKYVCNVSYLGGTFANDSTALWNMNHVQQIVLLMIFSSKLVNME